MANDFNDRINKLKQSTSGKSKSKPAANKKTAAKKASTKRTPAKKGAPAKKTGASSKKAAAKRAPAKKKAPKRHLVINDTRFRPGNQIWLMRSSHGRRPKFESPEALWNAAVEYFQWVDDNPIYTAETVKFQGEAKLTQVPKMRAMTLKGLCRFLDIQFSTWTNYRKNPDFLDICEDIEGVIYQYKFEGAAADLLNPSIIVRELGLKDHISAEHTGRDGKPIETITREMSQEEAARLYKEMAEGGPID